nr:ethanolamine ammonia-lyase subunit EutC [uncultured Desulfobulbus sp.]
MKTVERTTQKQPLARSAVIEDPWEELRCFTDARIALGRCGASLPLVSVLNLRMAHAQTRDAVHLPLDMGRLVEQLTDLGLSSLVLASAAADRATYLTRPDLGRRLDVTSQALVQQHATQGGCDLVLVVGDGLSSRAIAENAVPFIKGFQELCARFSDLRLGPVCLVNNCRVATGDEIGALLRAKMVAMLIGERPGLSSPNSMGIYLTYGPKVGTSDESRNCISNVRTGGLPVDEGGRKLAYLIEEAQRLKTTGVQLKDRMQADYLPFRLQQHLS